MEKITVICEWCEAEATAKISMMKTVLPKGWEFDDSEKLTGAACPKCVKSAKEACAEVR